MTDRERDILSMIEQDPLISQEALAEKAGITRGAVSAHISNLMKKGLIAGRGYVLKQGSYVAVVGGVNIDIGGTPYGPLIDRDSNPGRVGVSLGGVGRNIAHNLSLLGEEVRFLTAFGDDVYAQRITESCRTLGIDISRALRLSHEGTSVYLFINDPSGDMRLAVSDMDICRRITPEYLAANRETLNSARAVVLDANLPEESIEWLAGHCAAPLFADPVSVSKAGKLKGCLGRLHAIKPNRIEAQLLSGVTIEGEQDLPRAAEAMLATGLEQVFISLGEDGVFAADAHGHLRVHRYPARAVSMTGAGDAFMAALVHATLAGMDLAGCARCAAAAASVAVESAETINPAMSVASVRRRMEEGNGEEIGIRN